MLRKIVVAFALIPLASCKFAVIVGEGGSVESQSGLRDCSSLSYCLFAVEDTNWSETFTAEPKPGYIFVKWQDGTGYFCQNSTNPSCTIEKPEHLGDEGANLIVNSFEVGSISPIFRDVGFDSDGDGIYDRQDPDDDNDGLLDNEDPCPLNPILLCGNTGGEIWELVSVNGKDWAQPDLFANLSWDEVNDICPLGRCGGELNGWDVSGWNWATAEDLAVLFNAYQASPPVGITPGVYPVNSSLLGDMIGDGWRQNYSDSGTFEVIGITGLMQGPEPNRAAAILISQVTSAAFVATDGISIVPSETQAGAWLYRIP